MLHSSKATHGGMVYNTVELTVVLTNLAPAVCRGESCTCPEAASGWSCGSFPFGRRPYADSRVRLTEGQWTHNGGRGGVLSSRAPISRGMALQCPGW
jgi:hypothetical protein